MLGYCDVAQMQMIDETSELENITIWSESYWSNIKRL